MRKVAYAAAPIAGAAMIALLVSFGPAAAQRGGHGGGAQGGSGGGASAGSPGAPSFSGGRSGGGGSVTSQGERRFSDSQRGRSYSGSGTRVYGWRGDGRHHARRFRGSGVYGYAPYGYYAYGGCDYYYRRALATDSGYWWDRYYDCIGE